MANIAGPAGVEDFFFRQGPTLDSLRRLAAAPELVIYCGAGVSIDRTGVTWRQLVSKVFGIASANQVGRGIAKESVAYVLENIDDVQQAASIVVQAYIGASQSENDFLGSKLKDILYEQSGWDRGLVLRNLVQLVLAAARHGRLVRIVTTNYDTFIEDEFRRQYEALVSAGLEVEKLPGLKRRVPVPETTELEVEVIPPGREADFVEVIYLHGRVNDRSEVEGRLVLSEESYAVTRSQSAKLLRDLLGSERGVVTVGASLTDPPLVDALATTRDFAGPRYGLLTVPLRFSDLSGRRPKGFTSAAITSATVGEALALRSRHLGMELLRPLDHMQSAQYLEELRLCITSSEVTGDPNFYTSGANGLAYPERLHTWYEEWSGLPMATDPGEASQVLQETLELVRLLLKQHGARAGELLRVEAWTRDAPSSANRVLTLWANSDGPVVDRSTLRKEPISPSSENASVRAFLRGRPQRISLEELGHSQSASRWKTFLSVPVYVNVPVSHLTIQDSATLPVGVVTLTSTWASGDDDGADRSFFADAEADTLVEVKIALIAAGRRLFSLSLS